MLIQDRKQRIIAKYPLLEVDSKHQVIDLNRNGRIDLKRLGGQFRSPRDSFSIKEPLLEIELGRLQRLAEARGEEGVLTSKDLGTPKCSTGKKHWLRRGRSHEFELGKTTAIGTLDEVLEKHNPLPNQAHNEQLDWSIELGSQDGSRQAHLVLSSPLPGGSRESSKEGTYTIEELRETHNILGVHGLGMVAEDAFAIDKNGNGILDSTEVFHHNYRIDEPMVEMRQNFIQLVDYLESNDLNRIVTQETFGEIATFRSGGPFRANVSYQEVHDDKKVSSRDREYRLVKRTTGERRAGPSLTELANDLVKSSDNNLSWALDTERLAFYILEPRSK